MSPRSALSPKPKAASSRKSSELFYLAIAFVALFLTLALVSYDVSESPGSDRAGRTRGWVGQAGAAAGHFIIENTFGCYGAFAIPLVLLLTLAGRVTGGKFRPGKFIGIVLLAGWFTGIGVALVRAVRSLPADLIYSGYLPLFASDITIFFFYRTGAILIWATLLIATSILLFDLRPMAIMEALFYRFPLYLTGKLRRDANVEGDKDEDDAYPETDDRESSHRRQVVRGEHRPEVPVRIVPLATASGSGVHELPPLALLDPVPAQNSRIDRGELEENSRRLESKLASLGVEAQVIRTNPGPVITRYDLEPSADVKIARIAGLSDDIAMALRAPGIRILAPIPGENAVGVEIPNRAPETVFIREVLGSQEFNTAKSPLILGLGKDAAGQIFLTDLARMPHLLIAGATGSGKSVCINGLLLSLLFRNDPLSLRILLIDPKKIELSLYGRLEYQHLLAPPGLGEAVVTTPENAVAALTSVAFEMERRYTILADAGVRGLDEYHRLQERRREAGEPESATGEHLPYIVVVIDELADLMLTARREFEDLIVRLAQKARAAGIHLIVATQRPSVDVVTGLIKANFPVRIAFQVASRADSRTILDGNGAEALLGRGDMLYQGPGTAKLQRLHGALVTTGEVERVVDYIRSQPVNLSSFSLPSPDAGKIRVPSGMGDAELTDVDELFKEAARIVVGVDQGSVSILQRRLRVGYARAARLIDELERAGIVGPFDGSKAREVLVTPEELKARWGIE
ncbi:MAG: DNA translocase FtsK [Calditrichaeota bacterium]|nr:DNA translocase FtsK [Calditrichota bacterium]